MLRSALSIGLLFFLGGTAVPPCMAETVQTLEVICLPITPLPIKVAQMHGAFAKYGIDVHVKVEPNSEELRSDLASGKAHIAHAAVDNEVALADHGGADVVIVMGGEGSSNELISQPQLHTLADLRGHTLIVDALNTAFALQLKKILLAKGMEAGKDYQLKAVGATPLRLAAMREHPEYAASLLGVPTSLLARQSGFLSLGTTQELIGPYQSIGGFVQRRWAHDNATVLEHYIAAYVEAQRWLLDPTNQAGVIELLMQEWKLPRPLAEKAYGTLVGPNGFQKDAGINPEGFRNVLKIRAEVEGEWGGKVPSAEHYYDPSYYTSAVSQLRGAR